MGTTAFYQNNNFISMYSLPAPLGSSVSYTICINIGCTDSLASIITLNIDDGSCLTLWLY